MTYRNINVNGTNYKFVIGKQCTKVCDIGNIRNSELGAVISRFENRIRRKFGRDDVLIPWEDFIDGAWYRVTPADVRRFILGNGTVDPFFHDGPDNDPHTCGCGHTGYDVGLRAWPFDEEICGKRYYSYICNDCDDKDADEI